MLKPTRKLVAGGLLAFALVAVSLVAGGVSSWTPAALAQGTIPPAPGNNNGGSNHKGSNDQNSNDNSQDNSNGGSSQGNDHGSMQNGMSGSQSVNQDQSGSQSNGGRVSSPEQPLAYSDQWMTIQPGEWQWFAFKYSYDRSRNSDDDKSNDQAPANLRLDADPANGVSLLLVNKDQVQAWQSSGEKLQGFGAATPQTDKVQNKEKLDRFCHDYPNDPACTGGDRSQSACENIVAGAQNPEQCKYRTTESRGYSNWKGTIGASGTYYIAVRGDPRATGPIRYKFTFSGEGLSMK